MFLWFGVFFKIIFLWLFQVPSLKETCGSPGPGAEATAGAGAAHAVAVFSKPIRPC